jgi:hypothetical protein
MKTRQLNAQVTVEQIPEDELVEDAGLAEIV